MNVAMKIFQVGGGRFWRLRTEFVPSSTLNVKLMYDYYNSAKIFSAVIVIIH